MGQSDAELLRQIAQYASAIDRHAADRSTEARHSYRRAPYSRSRGANARSLTTRNRTLILDGPKSIGSVDATPMSSTQWISSRDRGHMTLTNTAAYESSLATKLARINDSREAKRKARLIRQEAKEAERLKVLASTTLQHEGATYRFNRKANLLLRVDFDNVLVNPTPAQTFINGVEFLKSPKTDNLFRKSTIKLHAKRSGKKKSSKKYCKYFTRSGISHAAPLSANSANIAGVCKNAKECPYIHDVQHRAICMHFLTSHGCDETRPCHLSHDPVPQNTPSCTHHLNGSCSKAACKFAHSAVSSNAPICPDFARNGWCSRGRECSMRHLRECPLFSNKGSCKKKNCKLPHIARANQASTPAPNAPIHSSSDVSASESDSGTDDYESEDFDEHAFGEFVRL